MPHVRISQSPLFVSFDAINLRTAAAVPEVEEGAIRIISRAAERTASVDVIRLCASTLCNFAGEGRARPKMSDSRTAQVCVGGR